MERIFGLFRWFGYGTDPMVSQIGDVAFGVNQQPCLTGQSGLSEE
ncbi:hypothetical protein PDR5_26480 [Pseudomonas sp. DR 5-09]|nr:hypothetical protein PDR5_26480 [Pseudomonas sp. DR 5-09]